MDLYNFLCVNTVSEDETHEVAISDRILDENGKVFKFKIKPISGEKFSELKKKATKSIKFGNKIRDVFDEYKFNYSIVIENTLEPNFKDAEALEKAGLNTPLEALEKSLKFGEICDLAKEIGRVSGLETTIEDYVDEVKN